MPASDCEEEPQSGAIRITPQREDIPAAAAATELCPALRVELESDDETDDDERKLLLQKQTSAPSPQKSGPRLHVRGKPPRLSP